MYPPSTQSLWPYLHRYMRSPQPGQSCGQRDRVDWGQSYYPLLLSNCGIAHISSVYCEILTYGEHNGRDYLEEIGTLLIVTYARGCQSNLPAIGTPGFSSAILDSLHPDILRSVATLKTLRPITSCIIRRQSKGRSKVWLPQVKEVMRSNSPSLKESFPITKLDEKGVCNL